MKNKSEYEEMYVNDESYSKEAVEYAKKRTEYEMGYINKMSISEAHKSHIKQHIYFTAREAYDRGKGDIMKDKKEEKQEDKTQTCLTVRDLESAYRTGFEDCKKSQHEILVYTQQDCNDLCAILARNGYCTVAYYLPNQFSNTAVHKGWKIVYYDPKEIKDNWIGFHKSE